MKNFDRAFQQSKEIIIGVIKEGVIIFYLNCPTFIQTDWSKTGIGFFLLQKHCTYAQPDPGCCGDGQKITFAGFRFLRPEETRYAPVEGEALAIAICLSKPATS